MEEDTENIGSVEVESGQSSLEVELEALQAIYVNEVKVSHNEKSTSVSIDLHPATADKLDEQYVRMTLKFILDDKYPHTIPEIHISNPRGLLDEKLNSIILDLKSISKVKIGNPMMFEIIDAAKEHLTVENRPCGECAICLYSFNDDDVFTKTDCYHYFHSHCLARYSKNAVTKETEDKDSTSSDDAVPDKELLCPVCRLPIHFEGSEEAYPPPAPRDEEVVISKDVLEIQKKMADLYQKQVDQGGIIDLEAEKNKFLLEISNVPTRVNNATEENNCSENLCKAEENDSAPVHTSQKGEGEKDLNLNANSVSENAVSSEEKTKNDKKYTKQSRNNYNNNLNRTNKRYDYSKPKYEKSDRERIQKDTGISSPNKNACNPEDCCDDPNSASNTSGRSDTGFHKRNERRNNYGPPRRYYDDDYSRGNYYKYPDSRGSNRGRRFAPNAYDRRNIQDHGYRGRGGRSNFEREAAVDENQQNHSKSAEPNSDLVACEEMKEPSEEKNLSDSLRDNSSKNKQYPRKKYSDNSYNERGSYSGRKPGFRESYPDRNASKHEYEETQDQEGDKDSSNRNFSDSYRDRRQYSDRKKYSDIRLSYGEKDSQSQRRGGYAAKDNLGRGSYGRNGGRGSYQNSSRRENSEENVQIEEGRARDEDGKGSIENESGKFPNKNHFSDQQAVPSYRGNRANSRRNGNSFKQASRRFEERRDGNRNGIDGSKDHKDSYPEENSDVQVPSLSDKNELRSQRDDFSEENSSKRNSHRNFQEDYPHRYEDRRDYNSQKSFRDPDRNRNNSDFQTKNPSFRRNQRYGNERPSFRNRNDSYQYKNNTSRKYNGDQNLYEPNPPVKHAEQENSELPHCNETSLEMTVADNSKPKNVPCSMNEMEFPPEDTSPNKPHSSESPCKVVPSNPTGKMPVAKPNASFSSNSPKMMQPPPGFSNPLKKVVYGLQAANPPPGFPRS